MPKNKIDIKKLVRYLKKGKSQADCAKIFGVSGAAISKSLDKANYRGITINYIYSKEILTLIEEIRDLLQKSLLKAEQVRLIQTLTESRTLLNEIKRRI